MRYAIFSDIHNNTEALSAVLDHARQQTIDQYFCLGDIGVDDCIDLVRAVDAPAVFGNWEVSGWRHLLPANRAWTLQLPPMRRERTFWLTHAAPLWPAHLTSLADLNKRMHQVPMTRLFPYLHYESELLWETIATLTHANVSLMFHGHTHRQIVWRFTEDNYLQKLSHATIIKRPGDTLIVGVGSVGRPEDGPSAAYTIYDDNTMTLELVRV